MADDKPKITPETMSAPVAVITGTSNGKLAVVAMTSRNAEQALAQPSKALSDHMSAQGPDGRMTLPPAAAASMESKGAPLSVASNKPAATSVRSQG